MPFVVVKDHGAAIGAFLVGAAIGAGAALLLTPKNGPQTRAALRRAARSARRVARETAENVAEQVADTFAEARDQVERRIKSTRSHA
jgi:gas vesicle protein